MSVSTVALKTKLNQNPQFALDCAEAFYEELEAAIPASKTLFADHKRQLVMFASMLEMIITRMVDGHALDDTLHDLGRMHAERGVNSMHVKAARVPFEKAIKRACEDIEAKEVAQLMTLYDRMVDAMSTQRRY